MIHGDEIIKRGTWLYDGSVRTVVVIARGDVFLGSGDEEDPPELRDDRAMTTFRIWVESPPASGEFPTCAGQYVSLQQAMDATSKLLTPPPRWE